MIDYSDSKELLELSEKNIEIASSLRTALTDSAKSKAKMDILLAQRIDALLQRKKNIGIEMSIILMINKEPELAIVHSESLRLDAEVKGLTATQKALESQMTLIQSLLKHTLKQVT